VLAVSELMLEASDPGTRAAQPDTGSAGGGAVDAVAGAVDSCVAVSYDMVFRAWHGDGAARQVGAGGSGIELALRRADRAYCLHRAGLTTAGRGSV